MKLKVDQSGHPIQAIEPNGNQTVSYDTTTQSAAVKTDFVRLIATTNCFVEFGSNPTATTASMFIVANVPEYFGITRGDKIAAVKSATAGSLYITESA